MLILPLALTIPEVMSTPIAEVGLNDKECAELQAAAPTDATAPTETTEPASAAV